MIQFLLVCTSNTMCIYDADADFAKAVYNFQRSAVAVFTLPL